MAFNDRHPAGDVRARHRRPRRRPVIVASSLALLAAAGMITTALRMADEGLLARPLYFQFVLGVKGAAPATVAQLNYMVSMLPPGAPCPTPLIEISPVEELQP